MSIWNPFLKTLGTLTLLLLIFPFNAIVVLVTFVITSIWNQLNHSQLPIVRNPKTILLSGGKMTKALQLARSFHQTGHRVILVETEDYWMLGNRFSRAIDRFYRVPIPDRDPERYIQALLQIAKTETVDFYIPVCSPVSSYYDSLAKAVLSGCCEMFHFDAEITKILDDKVAFSEKARSIGLEVPQCFKVTHPQQVVDFDFSQEAHFYILKSIPYDSVLRLDLTKLPCTTSEATAAFVNSLPISENHPWIMQEFIPGKEYCAHATVRDGNIQLYCCSESSAFQVNYEQIEQPEIFQWVSQFVRALKLTGQVSFDFIQDNTGKLYAIECNPRIHTAITAFYNHPHVADAYLSKTPLPEPLQPLANSKPIYWLYHELWRLTEVRSLKQLQHWFRTILRSKDAIFAIDDPLPFLMVHHWQIPLLLLRTLRQGKRWLRINFHTGKVVEFE